MQKLCYYAKAWYLAINDANIITEPFEAWVHGAVQPALYQKYKVYGFGYIPLNNKEADIPESLFHLQEKYMTHMVIWMEMN